MNNAENHLARLEDTLNSIQAEADEQLQRARAELSQIRNDYQRLNTDHQYTIRRVDEGTIGAHRKLEPSEIREGQWVAVQNETGNYWEAGKVTGVTRNEICLLVGGVSCYQPIDGHQIVLLEDAPEPPVNDLPNVPGAVIRVTEVAGNPVGPKLLSRDECGDWFPLDGTDINHASSLTSSLITGWEPMTVVPDVVTD